ncbi:hypothetical protein N7453_003458 [Penicillium expansum]|nr:hypothetical protein N7453_003458 [Penicillium expansum]
MVCRLGGQLKKAAAVLSNLFNSEHVSTFAKSDKLSTSILVMPLRQLYPDPAAAKLTQVNTIKVDIIAVHGPNPRSKNDADHAWDTWRSPSGNTGRLWLRDDLPSAVPESRIFLYEYDARVVYGKDKGTFIDKSNELLEAIQLKRKGAESRPIMHFLATVWAVS